MVAAVPQLVGVCRHPERSAGVSAWAWSFSAANEAALILWGVRHGQVALVAPSAVPFVFTNLLVLRLAVHRRSWRHLSAPPAVVSLLLLAPAAVAPFAVVGQLLPSATQWARARRGALEGISPTTWALEVAVSASWLTYGALHSD